VTALSKFALVPGVRTVYSEGPIRIYDFAGAGVATVLSGNSQRSAVPGNQSWFLAVVISAAAGFGGRILYGAVFPRRRRSVDRAEAWVIGGLLFLSSGVLVSVLFVALGLSSGLLPLLAVVIGVVAGDVWLRRMVRPPGVGSNA
jgi:hypothetical protein